MRTLIFIAVAVFIPASRAATLSIECTGPETLDLHLGQDPADYFYLQESTDLRSFYPFSMVLGETPSTWTLYPDSETSARFFRARTISIFALEDTDGDGIDDFHEIRHPVLTSGTGKLRAAGNTAILSTAVFQIGTDNEGHWPAMVVLPDGFSALQAIGTHTP